MNPCMQLYILVWRFGRSWIDKAFDGIVVDDSMRDRTFKNQLSSPLCWEIMASQSCNASLRLYVNSTSSSDSSASSIPHPKDMFIPGEGSCVGFFSL
jgi:hypothetical protein